MPHTNSITHHASVKRLAEECDFNQADINEFILIRNRFNQKSKVSMAQKFEK